jgi:Inositol phospholipid synthesis and fat-storage-inducing TM
MRPGARASGLPLSLERYNLVYMGFFSAIVLTGTIYSLIHGTHTYNVFLSNLGSIATNTAESLTADEDPSEISDAQESVSKIIANIPTTFLADRRNLLNRFFSKFAWFWTTLAFVAQAGTLRSKTPRPDIVRTESGSEDHSAVKEKKEKRAERQQKRGASTSTNNDVDLQATVMGALSISLLRYVIATILWVFFARWFLGPPVMERIRHYTGAVCVPVHHNAPQTSSSTINSLLPSTIETEYCYTGTSLSEKSHPQLFTSFGTSNVSPGILRPRWKGGHDISGHTYILIISSLYLLEEITPFLPYLFPTSFHQSIAYILPRPLWAPINPFSATAQQSKALANRNLIAILAILALLTLWTGSLAVTSIYFHTPQEKVSGLIVALTASLLIPKGG